jgi:hypothetical protein
VMNGGWPLSIVLGIIVFVFGLCVLLVFEHDECKRQLAAVEASIFDVEVVPFAPCELETVNGLVRCEPCPQCRWLLDLLEEE